MLAIVIEETVAGLTINIEGAQINYLTEPLQLLWQFTSDVGASHDSETRYPPPRCHEGTREDILKPLLDWIHGDSPLDRVLWLYGPADAGKSAIAQTISEAAQKQDMLAASFFFSQEDPKRDSPQYIFVSLAHQLAYSIPGLREPLEQTIRSNPRILQASLEGQLEKLILEPCRSLPRPRERPKTLVIDGMDKCGGSSAQRRVLGFFATALLEDIPFRIVLFSRPESHIREFFDGDAFSPFRRYLRCIALDDIFDPGPQIAAFLKSEFEETGINPPRGRTEVKWVERWIQTRLKKKNLWFDPDSKFIPLEGRRRVGIEADAVGMTSEAPKVYQNLLSFLIDHVSRDLPQRSSLRRALDRLCRFMSSLDVTSSLIESRGYRLCLLQQMSTEFELDPLENRRLRDALRKDEEAIADLLNFAFEPDGDEFKEMLLDLQGENAQSCADLVQNIVDKCTAEQDEFKHNAQRLLVKLCETQEVLPSSLFMKGVECLDADPQFGDDRHKLARTVRRSAILWRTLKHPFVLPFLGIDSDSFPGLLSLVSPWMANGTILIHLEETGGQDVDLRLFETSQGLAYPHSKCIVHGDLRGSNILVDADGHVCIGDLGLSVFSDVTISTYSAHRAGAVRWMAPELHHPTRFGLKYSQRTFASDVYSFAYVCVELYTGRPPFGDEPIDAAVLSRVMDGERPTRPPKMRDWLWSIVEMCWNQERAERPIMSRVVEMVQSGCPGGELVPLDVDASAR
ncbi:kinase-like protein [Moniliophthora roreri]|nr:kinase-like protein [Moniliophthora roreri]